MNDGDDDDRVLRLTREQYQKLSTSLRAQADIIIVDGVIVKNRYGREGHTET